MLPYKREHHFEGPGRPKTIKQLSKNDTKNRAGKVTVFCRFGNQFTSILNSKKKLKKITSLLVTSEKNLKNKKKYYLISLHKLSCQPNQETAFIQYKSKICEKILKKNYFWKVNFIESQVQLHLNIRPTDYRGK